MKTKADIQRRTQGGLTFTVPAGSDVEPIKDEPGVFWVKPSALPANSIERHDATYYGIRVTSAEVE